MRAPDNIVAAERKSIPVHHVVAVTLGNGLEFYDFLCYAIFAVYIGNAYFPAHDQTASLILTFGLSFISYLVRPVGAVVLGTLGDRIGRKPAMMISFACMGVGMLGMALTPSYATIGLAAPVIVVVCRMVQGFALGGEVGPTTAYLLEAAPPHRRGFYASMQYVSQHASIVVASLVGMIVSNVLTVPELESWGWRVAFLLGVVIIPFGIMIRKSLPETLHKVDDAALAPDATTGRISFRQQIKPYWLAVICGFFVLVSGTIGTYVITYMPTYAITTLHLSPSIAFATTFVTSGCAVICEPIAGHLSDLWGRRAVMLAGGAVTFVMILPAFLLLTSYPSPAVIYVILGATSCAFAFAATPVVVSLTESIPMPIRSGTVSTVYAVAISVFGGSTGMVITWLLKLTHHNPMTPAYYWVAAMALGLVAMFLIPESAPGKTSARLDH